MCTGSSQKKVSESVFEGVKEKKKSKMKQHDVDIDVNAYVAQHELAADDSSDSDMF